MQPTIPVAPPPVQLPDPSVLMYPWYIWGILVVIMCVGTFVGTWLITRRWER